MASTYYKYIKDGNQGDTNNNWNDAKWDGKDPSDPDSMNNIYWEKGAPYFFLEDIELLLKQKIKFINNKGQEEEAKITGLQCCAVKISAKDADNKLIYKDNLVLVPIVDIDNHKYRPTGLNDTHFYLVEQKNMLNRKGVKVAMSCRCVNRDTKAGKIIQDNFGHAMTEDQLSQHNPEIDGEYVETFVESENSIPYVKIDLPK